MHIGASKDNANNAGSRYFDNTNLSFDVTWELDVWGKFRRGIESADASLYASVMNYDDVLVTLIADVATNYITLRGLDDRIRVNLQNVVVQQEAISTSPMCVSRPAAQPNWTCRKPRAIHRHAGQAPHPQAAAARRGKPIVRPAGNSAAQSGRTHRAPIPDAAAAGDFGHGDSVQLLRRRPDIRRAEANAAAQSALIGFAKADLYPHFDLFGSIGYNAENPGDLFNNSSIQYQMGPGFRWDIFNYGRITNNVRVQDAALRRSDRHLSEHRAHRPAGCLQRHLGLHPIQGPGRVPDRLGRRQPAIG